MKILVCILGSVGFSVLLDVPKNKLLYISFGITLSAFVYEISYSEKRAFVSAFAASLIINIFGEITARFIRTPSTVIILPSTIPLLPGSMLFYSVNSLINGKYTLFRHYLILTAKTGLGIALGALIGSVIIILLKELKRQ
ncbi:MAG: threonine/serine exporter family protein [Eubacterium sp.]|nr:threonine/serine exporter family protein [Eubacterium sp.]